MPASGQGQVRQANYRKKNIDFYYFIIIDFYHRWKIAYVPKI